MLIEEDYVASKCGIRVEDLRQLLYRMSVEHVIRYIPSDRTTVIYLKENRLRPKNVKLSPERLERLKSSWKERADAMTGYVSEEDECRSRYLLRYFGQTESEDCGTCDICRRRQHLKKNKEAVAESLKSYIIDERGGDYTLEDIVTRFGSLSEGGNPDCLTLLREMVDAGSVPPYKVG